MTSGDTTKFMGIGLGMCKRNSKHDMVDAQLTYLNLSENISEGFSGRLHQLSVEGSADGERFRPNEMETPRVLLQEIQCLLKQNSSENIFLTDT